MLQSPPVRRALSSRLRLQHLKKVRVQRKDSDISSGIVLMKRCKFYGDYSQHDMVLPECIVIPGRVLVTPGSVVVTPVIVITTGSILVTPGSVITTGSILVTPGSVITTGSILVTPGSVITTGSILVTPGSVIWLYY
ncbi:hypothetical protein Tco_1556766 [Tanacetum coccineum]